ncbi:aspartate dehydrogenase [Steroidobacter sp.]|uniref:aspartate dehydrogenase n=1 Tax=Steroidobacter sp. TaxID=1978227 RepID=UPI001A57A320|nr:aspartate dehydrogenase [Steroidobacter sp.]MBL8269401.1 aspartate dehydrogenase [Steroidobacter sp.]
MRRNLPLGMIGFGAMGREVMTALLKLGETAAMQAVLVRPGREAPHAVHDVQALIAAGPRVVLECAGHSAVREFVVPLLRAGIDVIVSSVGALADDELRDELLDAEQGGGRALLPAGAIAGLDGLLAARLAGLDEVTYTSFKPPHAWRGTAAEQVLDLNHSEPEREFFAGSARAAALAYPKNVNVGVAIALVGLGMDATRVRLVSSRNVTDPLGRIEAHGAFGHFRFDIFARAAADNPKTSALTAYSIVQCARLGGAYPISGLCQRSTLA